MNAEKREAILDVALGSTKDIHMDRGTAVTLLVMFCLLLFCGFRFYQQLKEYYPSAAKRAECEAHGGWLLPGLPNRCIQPNSEILYQSKEENPS